MFTRRGFLFLLGAGTGSAGLLVASRGLFTIPERFVLAHAGTCSFCGKEAVQTRALAGVAGCQSRICNECAALCVDIIAEEPAVEVRAPSRSEPLPPAELAELERMFDDRSFGPPKAFHCNFCGHSQRDVGKLIAGPNVFTCDGCAADAWALMRAVMAA